MSHDEFAELCPLMALGALDGEELAKMSGHLLSCAECRAAVAQFQEASAGIAMALPPAPVPASLKERILSASRRGGAPPAPLVRMAVAAAAAFLLAIGMGSAWFWEYQNANTLQEVLAGERKDKNTLAKQAERAREMLGRYEHAEMAMVKGNENAPAAMGCVRMKDNWYQFDAHGLPALAAGEVYVLWVLPEAGAAKNLGSETSMGSGGSIVMSHEMRDRIPGKKFALSVEKSADVSAPAGRLVLVPAD